MKNTVLNYKTLDELFATLTTEKLLVVWESTEYLNTPECPTIRGWLMDEIEKRFPEAFSAWLDEEIPQDKDLRRYINAYITTSHKR